MRDGGSPWAELDPSWDVAVRDRAASRRRQRERSVRPLTADELEAVARATSVVLGDGQPSSAYRLLRPFDGGSGAFDSRHLDLLREVHRRVAEERTGDG